MANIIVLLGGLYLSSYIYHKSRGTPDPAKAARKPVAVVAIAMVILGMITYISIITM